VAALFQARAISVNCCNQANYSQSCARYNVRCEGELVVAMAKVEACAKLERELARSTSQNLVSSPDSQSCDLSQVVVN